MNKKSLQRALPLLLALRDMRAAKRVQLLPHLDNEAQDAICQCIHNCLFNLKIASSKRRALKRRLMSQRNIYRYLSRSGVSSQKRKKLLPQVGGSLSLILGAVLPLITQFLLPKILGTKARN